MTIEELRDRVRKLLDIPPSSSLLKRSIKIILPNKNNIVSFIVLIFISIGISILIGMSNDTVVLFRKAVELFNTIILVLIGVVFTGYAIFQALIQRDLLIRLLSADSKNKTKGEIGVKSLLQENNEYFAIIMMLYITNILFNVVLIMVFNTVPDNFVATQNWGLNNIIAIFLLLIYVFYSLKSIWEMKCFVYNVFQLFNAHAGTNAMQILNKGNNNGD